MAEFEVLVPVKRLICAKQRLGAVLTAPARANLMSEMSTTVLRALAASTAVSRVFVVTPDPEVADLALRLGAGALPDSGHGLNIALRDAVLARQSAGAQALAIFQGDLPWLTSEAVDDFLLGVAEPGAAALICDQHRSGTSALAWRGPPDLTGFAFGEDSFARHADIMRGAGLALVSVEPSRPFHDLDDADDLAEFSGARPSTATLIPMI